jgi:hypothetical protein
LVTANNRADAADVDRRVIQARLERAEVLIVDLEGDLKAAQSKLAQVSARVPSDLAPMERSALFCRRS